MVYRRWSEAAGSSESMFSIREAGLLISSGGQCGPRANAVIHFRDQLLQCLGHIHALWLEI